MSRAVARGAVRSSSIEALIGVFASSADATPAPSTRASTASPTVVRSSRMNGLRARTAPRAPWTLFIHDKRMQRIVLQLVPALQKGELDHERHPDHLAAELFHQPQRRGHGPAGGQQIVDGEHALPRPDAILVNGQRVAAVLQLVLDLDGLAG